VQLDDWTGTGDVTDKTRRKRLTIGYAVGAVTVGVALSFITYTAQGRTFDDDETIDVSLVQAPVLMNEPEPEVETEPPPPPKPKQKKRARNAKVSVSTPQAVPDSVPDEADPSKGGSGDDFDDVFGGEGGGVNAPRPNVAVKKAEPPRPPAPVFVSEREQSTPAIARFRPHPPYPSDAKDAGIQDTVVVSVLVTTQGKVGEVRVIRGHGRLAASVVSAVKQWRFEPATYHGVPVASWKTFRIPFRLAG
jgi:TonB family protein